MDCYGHVARDPSERKGFSAVSLAFVGSDARQWIGVNEARTVGRDQPPDGKAVLEQVEPFTPNFLAAGSDDLITRLRDATPGTHVRMEGLVERGSHLPAPPRGDGAASRRRMSRLPSRLP